MSYFNAETLAFAQASAPGYVEIPENSFRLFSGTPPRDLQLGAIGPLPAWAATPIGLARMGKLMDLGAEYARAISADIDYNGASFQADAPSRTKLLEVLSTLTTVPTGFYWVTADNAQVPFTITDLKTLAGAMMERGWRAFAKLQALKAAVRAAEDATTIEAVAW